MSQSKDDSQSLNILTRYWRNYGGFKALLKSYYFLSAVVLNILLWPHWTTHGWWESVLNYVPNLLGFSLGGFALWMAIGDEKFRTFLAQYHIAKDGSLKETTTEFCDINTVFVHFLVLQLAAIVFALLNQAYSGFYLYGLIPWCKEVVWAIWGVSYLFFTYSITATLAAVLGIYRVTNMYEMFVNFNKDE
ncbi:hypothetical protein [Pseudoalteromonas luteoviolacea]|uniref:Uncharacterized protein n=1 Tax=Pseudoalteromonas luteoviolacea DSM 6061 TaxID=1365250 RepID=A0A166X9C4_9GAMM|nr:hypothetical protein [Pseudoalteromonas luteoviolacea]KZN39832.1 hypothetical protein N475_13825 [Pseudoalteromonas luteoviolacea DSM 6061]MBE0385771.1 hypothetical protein [Pseudoalteromonas luteoviolacea DSM 6061]